MAKLPKNILCIDDSEEFLALLKRELEKLAHHPKCATKITDFLKLYRAEPPDACIVDINLSEGETAGLDVIYKIRQELKGSMPIIVLSRVSDFSKIEKALYYGASDFITKPLDAYFLGEKLNHFLNTHSDNIKRFLTVPPSESGAKISIKQKVMAIDEQGILINSSNYIAKGMIISIDAPIFERLEIKTPVQMQVANIRIINQSEYECYYKFLDNDPNLDKVRSWLSKNKSVQSDG